MYLLFQLKNSLKNIFLLKNVGILDKNQFMHDKYYFDKDALSQNPSLTGHNQTKGCGQRGNKTQRVQEQTYVRHIRVCSQWTKSSSFLKIFEGPLVTLFWTFGDVCPRFQNRGGFPCLCASTPALYGILRFTSGVTLVHLVAASMADKPLSPTYLFKY